MSVRHEVWISAVVFWILIALDKAVVVDQRGVQAHQKSMLDDNLVETCALFVGQHFQHTQIFQEAKCSADRISVTLVGNNMTCDQDMYVVGLAGNDVGKALNRWKRCKQRWQTTDSKGHDWCIYDCSCTGACEEVMVLKWPQSVVANIWTLCDISPLCNGFCHNQDVCYMYGIAQWAQGVDFCHRIHPQARMIEEHSDEDHQKNVAEAARIGETTYWIGGKRPAEGGRYEFYWESSGAPVTYTRWRYRQPYQGSRYANCIVVIGEFNWEWDDSNCYQYHLFMCQIDDK